jgi:Arc/MetJ-type ribon-helix-helix transcriptional regulator
MSRKVNEQTEKLTVNINHVDLGKVDLLVENGFFTNRSDFIRAAVRNELSKNEKYLEEKIIHKKYVLGIVKYNRSDFESYLEKNELVELKYIGLFWISDDITLDLMKKTVKSIDVKGTVIAPKEIKEYYDL